MRSHMLHMLIQATTEAPFQTIFDASGIIATREVL